MHRRVVLSPSRFGGTEGELADELRAESCSIQYPDDHGPQHLVPLIDCVDDIVLRADSPEMLQRPLNLEGRWACRHRMRFNIGPTKSTVMIWGRGAIRQTDASASWSVSGQPLQRVSEYKHLGVAVQSGGGWNQHIDALSSKVVCAQAS